MSELTITNMDMKELHADDEFNCRGALAPIDVMDLVKDIDANGLLQPVVAMIYSEEKQKLTGKKYLLIAGYRRHMAHKVLKKETIPCIIKENLVDEVQARCFNLSENLQRKDLSIIQEARAISRLHDLGVSEADTAERLSKSRGWVQVRFMLLRLPEEVQNEVEAGFITQGQIRELYSIFSTIGKAKCFEATKKLKDAKILGRRDVSVKPKDAKSRVVKKHRKRNDVLEMLDHMQTTLPNGLWSRCLAWCAGEITTEDLELTAKEYADDKGLTYTLIQYDS